MIPVINDSYPLTSSGRKRRRRGRSLLKIFLKREILSIFPTTENITNSRSNKFETDLPLVRANQLKVTDPWCEVPKTFHPPKILYLCLKFFMIIL
jgi:hypothetical protein